jgi:hypothetical protein
MSTPAISRSGELAITSIASSNFSSVSLVTGTPCSVVCDAHERIVRCGLVIARVLQPGVRSYWQAGESGALESTHFDVPQPKSVAPTKADNTQTGSIELR